MIHAPENTLAAFARAWDEGADGIELDVHLSRDGEVVVHHDADLRRTAGLDGRLAEMSWAELKSLDVGSWKDPLWSSQRIPALDEVLKQTPGDRTILIEIKCGAEIVPVLLEKKRKGLLSSERIWFVGFDMAVMAATKEALRDFRVLLNVEPEGYEGVREVVTRLADGIAAHGLDGVGAGLRRADWGALRYWKERGLAIFAWVARDADTARQLEKIGVDAAAADCPAELSAWLRG